MKTFNVENFVFFCCKHGIRIWCGTIVKSNTRVAYLYYIYIHTYVRSHVCTSHFTGYLYFIILYVRWCRSIHSVVRGKEKQRVHFERGEMLPEEGITIYVCVFHTKAVFLCMCVCVCEWVYVCDWQFRVWHLNDGLHGDSFLKFYFTNLV